MKGVIDYLNKEIKNDSTLVLALSGGSDSMCLLSLINEIKFEKNLNIVCAHVNHKLRKVSDDEELFVKKECEKLNLKLEIIQLNDFKNKKVNEAVARRKRYQFLKEVVENNSANYLLTAHHGDDLIETILMRLTRGSNLSGYVGIRKKSKDENVVYLRPLLDVTKQDILDYNRKNNVKYVMDESNNDLSFTRNRYRKIVLPFLKNEDKNVHQKYRQFSDELDEYHEFVNNYILKNDFIVDKKVVINKILLETDFIKRKTLEMLIKIIQKDDELEINKSQVKEMMRLLKSNNKTIDLNNGYKCIKEYDYLKIEKKNTEKQSFNFVLDKDISLFDWKISFSNESTLDSNFEIRLDSSEIELPLIVRNRISGDKIQVKNLNGTKKVKDILINEKVIKKKRDELPVITDSKNVILWLPGIKKSKFSKDKSEKYDIILKYEVRK